MALLDEQLAAELARAQAADAAELEAEARAAAAPLWRQLGRALCNVRPTLRQLPTRCPRPLWASAG